MVILIIALVFSVLTAAISIHYNRVFINTIARLYSYIKEFEFLDGDSDEIPEYAIQEKYENAVVLHQFELVEDEVEADQIVDTSLYLKKHIIGITTFVQEQDFMELAQDYEVESASDLMEVAGEAVFRNVTVYHLKDGRWIWRPVDNDDEG